MAPPSASVMLSSRTESSTSSVPSPSTWIPAPPVDRAVLRLVHPRPGDELDRLRIERVDELGRVGNHLARVVHDLAVRDGHGAVRDVVDGRAALARRVAGELRAGDLHSAAGDGGGGWQRPARPLVGERIVVVEAAAGLTREVAEQVDVLEPE